jgi:hypothetical protein
MSGVKLYFKRFGNFLSIKDQMVFPMPLDSDEKLADIVWQLKYGIPDRKDLEFAVSTMLAYAALINKSQKDRNYICENIKGARGIKK